MIVAMYESYVPGMILSLRPANERRRYKVTPSLIGWAQILNQAWFTLVSAGVYKPTAPVVNMPVMGRASTWCKSPICSLNVKFIIVLNNLTWLTHWGPKMMSI